VQERRMRPGKKSQTSEQKLRVFKHIVSSRYGRQGKDVRQREGVGSLPMQTVE
jgi:hypothetical protein